MKGTLFVIAIAIAVAFIAWSPVMITLISADLHLFTARGTDSLGGSVNEINPMKQGYLIGKL